MIIRQLTLRNNTDIGSVAVWLVSLFMELFYSFRVFYCCPATEEFWMTVPPQRINKTLSRWLMDLLPLGGNKSHSSAELFFLSVFDAEASRGAPRAELIAPLQSELPTCNYLPRTEHLLLQKCLAEVYYCYWSKDGDALRNSARTAATTVAWFKANGLQPLLTR